MAPATTPAEFAPEVATAYPESAAGFDALTRAYEDVRYGSAHLDEASLRELDEHRRTDPRRAPASRAGGARRASDRPIADRHPGRRDHPVLPARGDLPRHRRPVTRLGPNLERSPDRVEPVDHPLQAGTPGRGAGVEAVAVVAHLEPKDAVVVRQPHLDAARRLRTWPRCSRLPGSRSRRPTPRPGRSGRSRPARPSRATAPSGLVTRARRRAPCPQGGEGRSRARGRGDPRGPRPPRPAAGIRSSRSFSGSFPTSCSASLSCTARATSCCWTPSWMFRSIRRRSSSCAATSRCRDARRSSIRRTFRSTSPAWDARSRTSFSFVGSIGSLAGISTVSAPSSSP